MKDITNKFIIKKQYKIVYQCYFSASNGNIYIVDGKYVVLSPTKRDSKNI